MRQIVVAFERQSNCDRLREALESTGEFSCLTCRSAAQVKRTVAKLRLDLVVCGFKLTDESCETLYFDLPQRCAMLMVAPQARLELCAAPGIFKLPAPVGRGSLLASVRMLAQLAQTSQAPVQRTPEEQGLVGRAKALLMEQDGMTEAEAHRWLQKRSMDHSARLADTARQVLDKLGPGKDA